MDWDGDGVGMKIGMGVGMGLRRVRGIRSKQNKNLSHEVSDDDGNPPSITAQGDNE